MRIGIIGSYPPPYGGQSIHIQQLKRYMERHGGYCTVLNTGMNQKVKEKDVINFNKMLYLFHHLLKRPYPLVHVHVAGYQNYAKLIPPYLTYGLRGGKWVVTFHSGKTMISDVNSVWRILLNLMLSNATKIICVNKRIRDELIEQGIESQDFIVNPAFSINSNFNEYHLDKEMKSFFDNHSPIITSIGMFEPQYGFELLLMCGVKLKEYFLNIGIVLIVSGGSKRSEILDKINKLSLQKHVIILEDLPHEQCLEIIRRSDVFARPTLYDGDAMCVREALSLATPVIATRTAFRPPGVVLFDIEDQSSMFQAAIQVLKRERKKKSSTIVKDERFLKSLMQVYKSVLKE